MDRNTLIGFLLIGIVLFAFTLFNQQTPEQKEAQLRYADSIARIENVKQQAIQADEKQALLEKDAFQELPDSVQALQRQNTYGAFANAMHGSEETITLENDLVEIRISTKGGQVSYARLKEYKTHDSLPLILFDNKELKIDYTLVTSTNRVVNTSDLYFTPIKGTEANSVTMRLNAGEGSSLDFSYSLKPDDYMVQYTIQGHGLNGVLAPSTNSLDLSWEQEMRQQEKGRKMETQYTSLSYKFLAGDVENLSELKSASEQIPNRLKWIAYKGKFFSTILIADNGFETTTLDSKFIEDGTYLKTLKTKTAIPFDLQGKEATSFRIYLGPNHYQHLKSYDKDVVAEKQLDLEKLVPLGASIFRAINKYFILPIFDFLGKYIANYGLIIFLLTLIVKIILFPLTYKSYISTAKMRVLRPQVEEINAKFPGQDKAIDRQKATMDLYSRAGASPMSGCLPMLLQMPILIAMYMLFPSAIELRQESFLWAQDLSTYDPIVSWNTYIPIITPYLGNHLSLFCLLTAAINVVYTKFNADMSNTGQQQMPGMKAMMYMMPLMMLFFFNQNASGLCYYYFISTLITILQTVAFRYTINEEKLLAKLEANKKKPAKKSGFMKRLEDAQKAQQEVLQKQKNQRK